MKKAVILLSGGLDSATCLAMAKAQGFACYALSFAYGQRHEYELTAARTVAQKMGVVDHRVVNLDIGQFGASALTDTRIDIPAYQASTHIPVTYVPARNTILLSLALGWAESLGGLDIFYGANAVDYSGYPDCRPEYVASFETMANLATKAGVEALNNENRFRVHAPIISMSKAQIIALGSTLGVDYSQTVSCYQANDLGEACGECESCRLRQAGFLQAKLSDPTRYQKK